MHAACPAHPTLLDFMTLIISWEESKLRSVLLYTVWCTLLLLHFQICKSTPKYGRTVHLAQPQGGTVGVA
jgi:hypothetical protein